MAEVEVEKGVYVELSEEARELLDAFERFCRKLGGVVKRIRTGWDSCILPKPMLVSALIYTGERRKIYGWIEAPEKGEVLPLSGFDMKRVVVTTHRTPGVTWGELDVAEGRHQIKVGAKVKKIELSVSGKTARFDLSAEELESPV